MGIQFEWFGILGALLLLVGDTMRCISFRTKKRSSDSSVQPEKLSPQFPSFPSKKTALPQTALLLCTLGIFLMLPGLHALPPQFHLHKGASHGIIFFVALGLIFFLVQRALSLVLPFILHAHPNFRSPIAYLLRPWTFAAFFFSGLGFLMLAVFNLLGWTNWPLPCLLLNPLILYILLTLIGLILKKVFHASFSLTKLHLEDWAFLLFFFLHLN